MYKEYKEKENLQLLISQAILTNSVNKSLVSIKSDKAISFQKFVKNL